MSDPRRPAPRPMSLQVARDIVANTGLYRSRLPADLVDFLIDAAWQVLPRAAANVITIRQFPEDAA